MGKIDFDKIEEMIRSGEMDRRIEAVRMKAEEYLKAKGIEYTIEDKENWGKIVVFNYKGHKIMTQNINRKTGKLEMYYYSEEYSCKSCHLHI